MFKKIFIFFSFLIISISVFAESKKVKYLKGNISDKTAAIREADGEEADWICENSLDFVLENKDILGNDRELDGLAIATVLSIRNDYVSSLSEKQKYNLVAKYIDLFNKYNSSATVQTAVISKVVSQKNYIPYGDFTSLLNLYISSNNLNQIDQSVSKAIFSSFSSIGSNETFTILYTLWKNPKYKDFSVNIETSLSSLVPSSMNEVLNLIHQKDIGTIISVFNLVKNISQISQNSLCEIAENALSESILLSDDSSKITSECIAMQIEALDILSKNKWTRASSLALSYFDFAKTLFNAGLLNEKELQNIISSLSQISPVNAVSPLSKYLEELNSKKEQNEPVSDDIVLSVVNTLGAIGDKSAFDSLLGVTYLPYSESVLSAARGALAGLRW